MGSGMKSYLIVFVGMSKTSTFGYYRGRVPDPLPSLIPLIAPMIHDCQSWFQQKKKKVILLQSAFPQQKLKQEPGCRGTMSPHWKQTGRPQAGTHNNVRNSCRMYEQCNKVASLPSLQTRQQALASRKWWRQERNGDTDGATAASILRSSCLLYVPSRAATSTEIHIHSLAKTCQRLIDSPMQIGSMFRYHRQGSPTPNTTLLRLRLWPFNKTMSTAVNNLIYQHSQLLFPFFNL